MVKKILILIICLLCIGVANAALKDGIINYYDFENNFNNNITGVPNIYSGSPIFNTTSPKIGGYSYTAMGTANGVLMVKANFTNNLPEHSVAFWYKPIGPHFSARSIYVTLTASLGFQFEQWSDGLFDMYWTGAPGSYAWVNKGSCTADTWCHVVITKNLTGGYNTYMAAVGIANYTDNAMNDTAYTTTYLGRNFGAGAYSKSSFDQLILWNRTITTDEINTLYNSSYGLSTDYIFSSTSSGTTTNATITSNMTSGVAKVAQVYNLYNSSNWSNSVYKVNYTVLSNETNVTCTNSGLSTAYSYDITCTPASNTQVNTTLNASIRIHNASTNTYLYTYTVNPGSTILFDNVLPTLSYSTINSTPSGYNSSTFITVNATISDSNYNSTNISLYKDGIFNRSVSTNVSNFTALADGRYSTNITVTDLAGNINIINRTYVIDSTSASVAYQGLSTAAGSISQRWIYVNLSINDSNYNSTNITLYRNGIYNNSVSTNYTNFTSLSDGEYWTNISVSDLAGNWNSSVNRAYTILVNATIASNMTNNTVMGRVMTYNIYNSSLWSNATYLLNYTILSNSTNVTCTKSGITGNYSYNSTCTFNNLNAFLNVTLNSTVSIHNASTNAYLYSYTNLGNAVLFNNYKSTNLSWSTINTTANGTNSSTSPMIIKYNLTFAGNNLTNISVNLYNSSGRINSTNYTITDANSTLYGFFNITLNGEYYMNATVNTSYGTVNSTDTRYYRLDSILPMGNFSNIGNPNISNTSWYFNATPVYFNFSLSDANLFGYNISCYDKNTLVQEWSQQEIDIATTTYNVTTYNLFRTPGRKICNLTIEDDHTADLFTTTVKEPILGMGRPVIEFSANKEKVEFIWDERNIETPTNMYVTTKYDRVSPVIEYMPETRDDFVTLYWTVKFNGQIFDRSEVSGIPGHVVLWSGKGKSKWYDAVDDYKNSKITYEIIGNEIRYTAVIPSKDYTGIYATKSLGGLNSYTMAIEFDINSSYNITVDAYQTMDNGTLPFNVTVTTFSFGTYHANSTGGVIGLVIPSTEASTVKVNSTEAMNSITETIIGGLQSLVNASLYDSILNLDIIDSIYGDLIPGALLYSTDGGSYESSVVSATGETTLYLEEGTYFLNASATGFSDSAIYSIDMNMSDELDEEIVLDKSYNVTILRERTGLQFNRTYIAINDTGGQFEANATIFTLIKCPDKIIEHYYENMSEIIENIDCPFTSWQTFVEYPEVVATDGTVFSYFREVVPTITDTNIYLYMLEAGTQGYRRDDPVQYKVNLRDISGEYINGYLQILKSINEVNEEVIYMPYDVQNKALVWIQKNSVYTPCIIAADGTQTCLADLYIESDSEGSLTVPDIPLYNVNPQSIAKIGFEMVPDREDGQAWAYFRGRNNDGTYFYNVNLTVQEYNQNNNTKGEVVYNYNPAGGFSTESKQVFPLSKTKTYIYSITYQHTADGATIYHMNDQLLWYAEIDADAGINGEVNTQIADWFSDSFSQNLKIIIGLLLPLFLLLLVSQLNVEFGVIAACALMVLFSKWGFYTGTWIESSGWLTGILAFVMVLNAVSLYRKLRRTT